MSESPKELRIKVKQKLVISRKNNLKHNFRI